MHIPGAPAFDSLVLEVLNVVKTLNGVKMIIIY